jgi:hypothetical protein
MSPEQPIRARLSRRNIPHNTIAALASTPSSVIYVQEVSLWAAGHKIPQHKFDRLMAVLVDIEKLLDACVLPPDLRNPAAVRQALDRLPELLAENARRVAVGPATVQYAPEISSEVASVLAVDTLAPEKVAALQSKKKIDHAAQDTARPILSTK